MTSKREHNFCLDLRDADRTPPILLGFQPFERDHGNGPIDAVPNQDTKCQQIGSHQVFRQQGSIKVLCFQCPAKRDVPKLGWAFAAPRLSTWTFPPTWKQNSGVDCQESKRHPSWWSIIVTSIPLQFKHGLHAIPNHQPSWQFGLHLWGERPGRPQNPTWG